MDLNKRKEKVKEGLVILGWIIACIFFMSIFLVIWLVFRTKIAMVLFLISTLPLIFWLLVFVGWLITLKD